MQFVAFILAATTLLAHPAFAAAPPSTRPAGLERVIGEETTIVVDADLSRVDFEAASQWLAEVVLACSTGTDAEVANARAVVEITRRDAIEWVKKFRAAGGSYLVATTEFEWILDAGFALYVPLPLQTPSKPVEELFAGLHWGRRNSVVPVKTLDGNVVGIFAGASQELRPANRPDFAAAMADLSATAPLRVVIAPDVTFREKTPQQWAASASILAATEWLAISADPKAGGTVDVKVKGNGEAGAQFLFDRWAALVKRTFDPAEPRDGLKDANEAAEAKKLVAPLTPRFDDDRLRLSLAAGDLPKLITSAQPALRQAQRIRVRDESHRHMTRLLVGLRGYAAKHGDWPYDLHDVAPFLGAGELSTIWLNPAAERVNPGYVYVRPAAPIPPNDRAVLYENRAEGTQFGDWRLVGFADGRVEVVYDEARFDRLTGKR